jgi:hypothetical protein
VDVDVVVVVPTGLFFFFFYIILFCGRCCCVMSRCCMLPWTGSSLEPWIMRVMLLVLAVFILYAILHL